MMDHFNFLTVTWNAAKTSGGVVFILNLFLRAQDAIMKDDSGCYRTVHVSLPTACADSKITLYFSIQIPSLYYQ